MHHLKTLQPYNHVNVHQYSFDQKNEDWERGHSSFYQSQGFSGDICKSNGAVSWLVKTPLDPSDWPNEEWRNFTQVKQGIRDTSCMGLWNQEIHNVSQPINSSSASRNN